MARVKVSEHSLYQLFTHSHLPSTPSFAASPATTATDLTDVFGAVPLVVKVDQGIKQRGKQGLVQVNQTATQVVAHLTEWSALGWRNFVVVPFLPHQGNQEHYLSLELVRAGWRLIWAKQGGIDVEATWDQTQTSIITFKDITTHTFPTFLPAVVVAILPALLQVMQDNYLVFLECNPLVIEGNTLHPLDFAGLVDNTGGSVLTPVLDKNLSELELRVAALDAATPASLKCRLVNQDGAIWMLLSGGGASLVLADEVADQGLGAQLGNYGEYSGAPTTQDTELYTNYILDALLLSQAPKKALIIAGGVANFTDVKKTFLGIITALKAHVDDLRSQGVKVFVRRGGPNEVAGLKLMSDYLTSAGILGSVHGHRTLLTEVVHEVKEFLHA